MANYEQRLQALESKMALNQDGVAEIILVSFVSRDELEIPISHIWYGDDHFYMTEDETEEGFNSRARAEIRKIRQAEPSSILLLFGNRATNKDNTEN